MKSQTTRYLSVVIASFAICTSTWAKQPRPSEWKEVYRGSLVTVYQKETSQEGLLAFKAVGTLSAPIEKVVSVIRDTDRRSEWAHRIKKAQVLREISPLERVEYYHASAPWPVSDRDIVIRTVMKLDEENEKVVFNASSIENELMPPQKNRVRALIYYSNFELTRVDEGSKTQVVAEIHGDPKGLVPKWVVNLVQKRVPQQTLVNLTKQLQKKDILPDQQVTEFFQKMDEKKSKKLKRARSQDS